jgi:uncharacterized protein YggE
MQQRTRTWTGWIGGAAIVCIAALTAAGCSSSGKTAATMAKTDAATVPTTTGTDNGPTIVVAGHGEVDGTPDTMTMSIGVTTTDASAQTALDKNSQEANALQDTLKTKGVDKKDMQTSDLSISQNYDKNGNITGYRVSNMVTVTLHDLATAGDVIDAGAAAAGNDITFNGIQLSIDDTSALLRAARQDAVKQAITHAQQLADAAGVKLGAVQKIDDTGTVVPQPLQYDNLASGASAKEAAPIQAGSQQLSVDVTVTFAVSGS